MPLGIEVGLDPSDIVLDRDPAPLPKKGAEPPQFSAHVCCGQTDAWIKMPIGTKLGIDLGRIVLHGDPAPAPTWNTAPNFWPMSVVAKQSPISATVYHLLHLVIYHLLNSTFSDGAT